MTNKLYNFVGTFIKETDITPYNFTGIVENLYGTKSWYLNGKQHRLNGPAIEHYNGAKEWYLDDELHRIDGPAIEWPDGTQFWYINGERIQGATKESFKLLVDIMKLKGILL